MAKKTKRKLPPHIVLPNGMWRFVKAGSRQARAKKKVRSMARKSRRRSSGARMGGLNKWVKIAAFAGLGSVLAPRVNMSPSVGGAAGAYLGGGNVAGAAVGYIAGPMVAGFIGPLIGGMSGMKAGSNGYVV